MIRRPMARSLLLAAFSTCLWPAAPALAGSKGGAQTEERRCEVAFALDDLKKEQRKELHRICLWTDDKVEAWLEEPGADGTARFVRQALIDLIAYDEWQVAALARLVDNRILDAVFASSYEQVKKQMSLLDPVFADLKQADKGKCKALYKGLESYIEANEPGSDAIPQVPFTTYALRSREKRCAAEISRQQLDELAADYVLFTVVADSPQTVFYWGGKNPGYHKIAAGDGIPLGRRTAFVLPVPRLVPVVVETMPAGYDRPLVWGSAATADAVRWGAPTEIGCFHVDAQTEERAETSMLIDGFPIDFGPTYLAAGNHTFKVLRSKIEIHSTGAEGTELLREREQAPATGGEPPAPQEMYQQVQAPSEAFKKGIEQGGKKAASEPEDAPPASAGSRITWYELMSDRIAIAGLSENVRCEKRHLDLGGLSSKEVALVDVGLGKKCTEAGVDAGVVNALAKSFLQTNEEELGIKLSDMSTWSDVANDLTDILSGLEAVKRESTGGDRGNADIQQAFGQSAAEVVRQGANTLLTLDIACQQRRTSGKWRYTVIAEMIDLQAALKSGRDRLSGYAVRESTETEVEKAADLRDLPTATVAALARLLEVPHVQVVRPERSSSLYSKNILEVRSFLPKRVHERETAFAIEQSNQGQDASSTAGPAVYPVDIRARLLNARDAEKYCDQLGSKGNLAGFGFAAIDPGENRGQREIVLHSEEFEESTHDFQVLPHRRGTYLVTASLRKSSLREEDEDQEEDDKRSKYYEGDVERGDVLWRSGICVEVGAPDYELVGTFTGGGAISGPYQDYRPENASILRAEIGFDWPVHMDWARMGVVLAYSRVEHNAFSLPSWHDLGALEGATADGVYTSGTGDALFDESGRTDITWVRNSMQVGVSFGFTLPLQGAGSPRYPGLHFFRRMSLVASIVPVMFDLGFIDTSEVPEELDHFLGSRSSQDWIYDFDVGACTHLGISLQVAEEHRLLVLWSVTFAALDDAIMAEANEGDEDRRKITHDTHVGFGLSVGVGWGL